ncbi:MAG: chorismate mutase [Gammaproteobacteria bacterium]|nr:chorismate mutase [Gammaproteobacteria bacterium]
MTTHWTLLEQRARLRQIDTQLIVLLARRFEIMREIRDWKKLMGVPLVDARREEDVLRHCKDLGSSLGVPESLLDSLYSQLFEAVRGPLGDDVNRPGLTDIKADSLQDTENCAQAPGNR